MSQESGIALLALLAMLVVALVWIWARQRRSEAELRRSREQLRARSESLATINAIADTLHRSLGLDRVARRAVASILDSTPFHGVAIFALEEDSGVLRGLAAKGFAEETLSRAATLRMEGSLSGLAVRRREVVVSEDLAHDERIEPSVREALVREGCRRVVAVPLVFQDQVLGAMTLVSDGRGKMAEDDRETLLSIGKTIGLSMATARYVDRLEREVAERRRAEEKLVHSQKMQAVGQLAGGIAHDFNNLLMAMLGNAELALNKVAEGSAARENLRQIRDIGRRAASLTRQLLSFSRRQAMEPVNLDLNRVVEPLRAMLHRLLGEDVRLEFTAQADLDAVHADPGQIEQVLLNLCLNSRDAMPDGGTIRVETANVELDEAFCGANPWARPGRYVRLQVTDQGRGMSSEVLQHIFEPFFTTKEVGKGTGLGLAVVFGIVEQHGGLMNVDSEAGRGTCVNIYLPAVRRTGPFPAAPEERDGAGKIVLLADDDETVRTLGSEILQRSGYRVISAPDGRGALAAFEQNASRLDLAVVDAMMPGMDGREVLRRIRSRRQDLPVILSLGYECEGTLNGCAGQEAVAVIRKPYGPNALLQAVRTMLDR